MILNTISQANIWKDLDEIDRYIRIIVYGSIVYVILHALMINYEDYKKYLYYFVAIDIFSLAAGILKKYNKVKDESLEETEPLFKECNSTSELDKVSIGDLLSLQSAESIKFPVYSSTNFPIYGNTS